MKTKIFEQSNPGFNRNESFTNLMTKDSAGNRIAGGFKVGDEQTEQNAVIGVFLKPSGSRCSVHFRNGETLYGSSRGGENLASFSPARTGGMSQSNGMICNIDDTQDVYYFYNKNRSDFQTEMREFSSANKKQQQELGTLLDTEETANLQYYTKMLGQFLIKDPNMVNQAITNIKYYVSIGGRSIYFGYLKSALNAEMAKMNRKIKTQGGQLATDEMDLYKNFEKIVKEIPETVTTNPTYSDLDEFNSQWDTRAFNFFPFTTQDGKPLMTPQEGVPFVVYTPKVQGAEAARKGAAGVEQSNVDNTVKHEECIKWFREFSCFIAGRYGDKRARNGCGASQGRISADINANQLRAAKDGVAGCWKSGVYESNRANVKESGEKRKLFRMIENDFFAPGGVFKNPSIPCAFINVDNPNQQQSVKYCFTESTKDREERERQQESYSFKNNVHKLLTEAKERKKKEILENDIIETKFVGILESIEKPTRKNINESVKQILSETKRYMSKKYDKEIIQENLGNVYKFITAMVGDEDDIKEMFVKKTLDEILVKKLGMDSTDPMTIHIIDEVSNKIDADNIPDMITDCHYLAVQIAEAIPTAYANKLTSDSNNGFLSTFQEVITGKLQDSDTSKKLISMLSGPVCETLNGIQSKMDEKIKGFKQNLFQKD
jgi:hypothetical protein